MGINYLWWACCLGLLTVMVVGAKALWDSKTAPFFLLREEAEMRVRRLAPVALVLLAVNVSLLAWRRQGSARLSEIIATSMPTSTLIPATLVRPSIAAPTLTATAVPGRTPRTPSPTFESPVSTPTEEWGGSFQTPILAQGVSEDNLPLEAGEVFPEGTKQVYLFFSYTGMEKGRPWTQTWYRGEQEVWSQTKPWRLGGEGSAWTYMELTEGFPPGEYEVRLYIDRRLQQRVEFTVEPAQSRAGE